MAHSNLSKKAKRKAHRKKLRELEPIIARKRREKIDKWIKEWYETRGDYNTNKKPKKLSWNQIKKLINKK